MVQVTVILDLGNGFVPNQVFMETRVTEIIYTSIGGDVCTDPLTH